MTAPPAPPEAEAVRLLRAGRPAEALVFAEQAVAGKTVAYRTDMVVDAEDLLNHHHRCFRRGSRIGAVAAELKMIRRG